ncbi:MAG: 50S ribosomal protein L29 [candidate division WOR-3 bacterium]|nr:50S ribosomal protein L29 [candidate division WOR-3 bacterium]
MKPSEIRNMTKEEIARMIKELKDEHFKLRMRRATEELPNPLRLRMLRRDIARLMTILKEKEQEPAKTTAETKPRKE